MATMTIKLKQQTPIWAFRPADVCECPLRATEVKPKLDHFLVEVLKLCIQDCWFQDKSNGSLRYKLHIHCDEMKTSLETGHITDASGKERKAFPAFFGNEEDNNKQLYMLENVKAEFFSFYPELIEVIKENILLFFSTYSFGTRQDKGFGFFYPESVDGETAINDEKIKMNIVVPHNAQFVFDVRLSNNQLDGNSKYSELLYYIYYFHQMLRSGILEPGVSYRSFLYHYVTKIQHKHWEKSAMRYYLEGNSHFYNERLSNEERAIDERTKSDPIIYREFLGLSSSQSWSHYKDNADNNGNNDNKGDILSISVSGIERMKSPITYRPALTFVERDGDKKVVAERYHIYICFDPDEPTIKSMRGKHFTISNSFISNSFNTPIDIAASNDFSLMSFLDAVVENGRKWMDENKRNSKKENMYVDEIIYQDDKNWKLHKLNRR